jgi:hypothetical protein
LSSSKVTLYAEDDHTTIETSWPLTAKVDLDSLRKEVGIPEYVDLEYFPVRRATVVFWAAMNAAKLHELYPDVYPRKVCDDPIRFLLFGGGAVKLHCRSSNGKSAPFYRELKDLDLMVPKKQVDKAKALLLGLGEAFGSQFIHFLTRYDKRYNGLRAGRRFRYHVIDEILEQGPVVGVLDLFADSIELRHKIDCRQDFGRPQENPFTISLGNIMLSKCQYILDAPAELGEKMRAEGQSYRILNYEGYDPSKVIVGMELKDMKDVSSVLYDHEIGSGAESVDIGSMVEALRKDEKLRLTVRLNLENLLRNAHVVTSKGDEVTNRVRKKLEVILREIPPVEKDFRKAWWEEAVETPTVS